MSSNEGKIKKLLEVFSQIITVILKFLGENEPFSRLEKDALEELLFELVIFNLYQIERTVSIWLKDPPRKELMDGLIAEIVENFTQINEQEMQKRFAKLTTANVSDYLEQIDFRLFLKDFPAIYGERAREYSRYPDSPDYGEGLEGTLLWEAGNRMAGIFGEQNNPQVIMKISLVSNCWVHFNEQIRQIVLAEK
jgi:hypothetical protein